MPGGIATDKYGRMGWWHNSPGFAVVMTAKHSDGAKVWLNKKEDGPVYG
jgi:hypothetical protein